MKMSALLKIPVPKRSAAAVEWGQPEFRRHSVWATVGGVREVT